MELNILYALQNIHTDWFSKIMSFVTMLGDNGIFWILTGALLLCFKKTRTCGSLVLVSMAFCFIAGNLFLKNLLARERPFVLDNTVKLLVEKPWDYSFPSGHTMHSFTAATMIFMYYKKAGSLALLLASLIAFSRMYLFLHYPSDILGGLVIGVGTALIIYYVVQRIQLKNKGRQMFDKVNSL